MTPIVNGLAEKYEGQIMVYQLNATERNVVTLQQRYGVRGHPSFALLDKDEEVIVRFLGPQAESVLDEAMNEVTAE